MPIVRITPQFDYPGIEEGSDLYEEVQNDLQVIANNGRKVLKHRDDYNVVLVTRGLESGNVYYLKTNYASERYRIFLDFIGRSIIVFDGFKKDSQEIPQNVLDRASDRYKQLKNEFKNGN